MKNFTLLILLGLTLHFSGFSQGKSDVGPIAAKDFTARIIKFYPNPATTIINFEFQKGYDKSYSLQIYNFLGKKVLELNNVSITNQVNLNDFNRGVYIFQLRDKSGKLIESGKFQVSK